VSANGNESPTDQQFGLQTSIGERENAGARREHFFGTRKNLGTPIPGFFAFSAQESRCVYVMTPLL
jgi:hypothetical protein